MAETIPDQNIKPKKKPKLTQAEKIERARLAALQLKKQLIREQFLREIELHKKSLKRSKFDWDKTLGEIKAAEFRKEFEEWGVNTELFMEKKEKKIDFLVKTLDETNEMRERNLSNHLEQLKYLKNCHKSLVEMATKAYEMEASEMIVDSVFDLIQTEEVYAMVKHKCENALHSVNAKIVSRLRRNHDTYLESRMRVVATEIENCYFNRNETYEKMQNLHKNLLNFQKTLEGEFIDTQKSKKFIYFMQRQDDYVKENDKLNSLEGSSRRLVSKLERELLNLEAETIRKKNSLKMEKAYFVYYRSVIRKSIELDKMITHEKLLNVSNHSYEVIKKLKEIMKKGELLLSLASCCGKLMTEKEKVNPRRNASDEAAPIPEYNFELHLDLMKHIDLTPEEIRTQMADMKNFWHRCSTVQLHNILLTEEKRKLNEENEKYRDIIRSMKKSDDVNYILDSIAIKQA